MERKYTETTRLYEIRHFSYLKTTILLIIKEMKPRQDPLVWFLQRVKENSMR